MLSCTVAVPPPSSRGCSVRLPSARPTLMFDPRSGCSRYVPTALRLTFLRLVAGTACDLLDRRPLVSTGKLHFPPLSSSTPIRGILPSWLVPRTAQSACPSLMFNLSHLEGDSTMACNALHRRRPLPPQPGLAARVTTMSFWLTLPDSRSLKVRELTFPAPLPSLLLWPLSASGFVVLCQLARPRSLRLGSCPSSRSSASSFIQIPSHGGAIAFL